MVFGILRYLQPLLHDFWNLLHGICESQPLFFGNAVAPVSCAKLLRIFTFKSLTSTSIASCACRRLTPRLMSAAKMLFLKDLASLSSFRLMVDSCTPSVFAICAKV